MHHRKRHIENVLLKRAKIFPVLGVLGPRQVGKSTFLMQDWARQREANYLTFDKQDVVMRAKRAPEQFLLYETQEQTRPVIIDEAQKVPQIFDSIKALVDEKRRMGLFTLSGSVEFSSRSGVRESLAGRLGTTRLYPLTLREMNDEAFTDPWVSFHFNETRPVSTHCLEKWLERGGMPIFCALSDSDERTTLIQSWLETICYRDIPQFKDGPYDSELALNLLSVVASRRLFSLSHIAHELGATRAAIKKHLSALEALFLIYALPSFENPRAQSHYRLFDPAVLNTILGGKPTLFSRHSSLVSLVMNEIYAQYEYSGRLKPKLYYYKTRAGAGIDLVLQTKEKRVGIECLTTIDLSPYRQRGMKSFLAKYPDATGYFIAPIQKGFQVDKNMFAVPWTEIA